MKFDFTTDQTSVSIGQGTDFDFLPPIEGLEIPQIRTSRQNYSGRDGGRVNAQYFSPRLISFQGHINEDTCQDHEQARKNLQAGFPIRTLINMQITTPAGDIYVTDGHVIDLKMDFQAKRYSQFKIDFLCRSSYFLSSSVNSLEVPRFQGGGFILPVILPIIFAPGVGTTNAVNNGTETVYPVIKIEGSATDPVVTHVSTGQTVGFNITLAPTDKIVVDMNERTATLNGSSALSIRTPQSRWWGLDVGSNPIRFNTSSGTDTGTVRVIWRDSVLTI